jgi:hypothetical protein
MNVVRAGKSAAAPPTAAQPQIHQPGYLTEDGATSSTRTTLRSTGAAGRRRETSSSSRETPLPPARTSPHLPKSLPILPPSGPRAPQDPLVSHLSQGEDQQQYDLEVRRDADEQESTEGALKAIKPAV